MIQTRQTTVFIGSTYPIGISTHAHPSIFKRTAILLLPSTLTSSPTNPVRGPLITRTCSPRAKGGTVHAN